MWGDKGEEVEEEEGMAKERSRNLCPCRGHPEIDGDSSGED